MQKYETLATALNFILFNNLGEIYKDKGESNCITYLQIILTLIMKERCTEEDFIR